MGKYLSDQNENNPHKAHQGPETAPVRSQLIHHLCLQGWTICINAHEGTDEGILEEHKSYNSWCINCMSAFLLRVDVQFSTRYYSKINRNAKNDKVSEV